MEEVASDRSSGRQQTGISLWPRISIGPSTAGACAMRAQARSTSALGFFIDGGNRRKTSSSCQCPQPWMGRGREVDVGSPDLIKRADGGPYHAREGLDILKLAEIRLRKRLADSVPKAIWIDRRKKTAGKSRRHLGHGEDLNAVRARPGGVDPGHMPGESRVNHDCTPHVLHP